MNIHGYAIVCSNDCIADAEGRLPSALMNDADWQYFQNELDLADLVVVGRISHEAAPNTRNRQRLILSRGVAGFRRSADGWWWNPDSLPWADVVDHLGLAKKRIAVPGGQAVFDYFLTIGFAAFHLSRAQNTFLAHGRKAFSSCNDQRSVEKILQENALSPQPTAMIDAEARITLTIFTAAQAPAR